MERDDVVLSVVPHATSKIARPEDLFTLQTHGFRGEALATIAEVSQLEVQSRTPNAVIGFSYKKLEREWVESAVGMPQGTIITVSNIFYNIPARRKFLKSPFTEFSHITQTLTHFALIYPMVAFRFLHNGETVYHLAAQSDWRARVYSVLGSDYGKKLLEIHCESEVLQISGFASHPHVVVNDRKAQYFFVNNRFVRDPMLMRAVSHAYEGIIPRGKHPVVVLSLTLDPHLVDVNVHPRKLEVKFRQASNTYSSVVDALRRIFVSDPSGSILRELPHTDDSRSRGEFVFHQCD